MGAVVDVLVGCAGVERRVTDAVSMMGRIGSPFLVSTSHPNAAAVVYDQSLASDWPKGELNNCKQNVSVDDFQIRASFSSPR